MWVQIEKQVLLKESCLNSFSLLFSRVSRINELTTPGLVWLDSGHYLFSGQFILVVFSLHLALLSSNNNLEHLKRDLVLDTVFLYETNAWYMSQKCRYSSILLNPPFPPYIKKLRDLWDVPYFPSYRWMNHKTGAEHISELYIIKTILKQLHNLFNPKTPSF